MVKAITDMHSGEEGVVVSIAGGGRGFAARLETLGIRAGKRLRKVSAQFWAGPVVINVDNRRIALGFGVARRVLVEVGE